MKDRNRDNNYRTDWIDSEWERVKQELPIGSKLYGTVFRTEPFGIFLDIGYDVIDRYMLSGIIDILTKDDEDSYGLPMDNSLWPKIGDTVYCKVVWHRDVLKEVSLAISKRQEREPMEEQMRISKIEHWLLDSVSQDITGFSWIVPNSRELPLINRDPIDSIQAMASIMKSLFDRGYILAITRGDLADVHQKEETLNLDSLMVKGFIPSLPEIEAALKISEIPDVDKSEELNFFLTAEGGGYWERLSHPTWHKYIEVCSNAIDETGLKVIDLEIRGIDVDWMSHYLQLYHILCPFDENYYPILETRSWAKMESIQFFYWKAFSQGYKVTCQLRIKTMNEEDKLLVRDRVIYNSVWKLMNTWYQGASIERFWNPVSAYIG